ncbi:MAG: hypothetical protein A4E74_00378 [Syntrophus sp. PtaB.Bin075]|nr:MAG: hypothetical protein A4E74_00378 [Syntrophus sp. PtaB.Bin075]
MLVGDTGPVELLLHAEYLFLVWLQKRVETADDRHRQDHVAVLAAYVDIAQHIVGDAPDKIHDAVMDHMVHGFTLSWFCWLILRERSMVVG